MIHSINLYTGMVKYAWNYLIFDIQR